MFQVMERCLLSFAALSEDIQLTTEGLQELRTAVERKYTVESGHLSTCATCLPRKPTMKSFDAAAAHHSSDEDYRPFLVETLKRQAVEAR